MLADLLVVLGLLVVTWAVASVPAYLAGKFVTGGKATFGQAMVATLGGIVVYGLTAVVAALVLGAVLGETAVVWAGLLGFIAFLGVYRSVFHTGWLGAFAIAVVSVAVALVLSLIAGALFGVSIPSSVQHGINL